MQLIRSLGITGRIHLALTDEYGVLKEERFVKNLIVDAGIDHITNRLDRDLTVQVPMEAIAIGSDSTPAAAGDTDIGTEQARVTMIVPFPDAAGGNQVLYEAAFGPGVATSPPDLTEAGIFNDSSAGPASGTMLARGVFAAITKGAGDTLTITWTIQFAAV